MADLPSITRRGALLGALASTAALAVPATAAVTRTRIETAHMKARRLQRELSDTLAQLVADGGPDYVAITMPATVEYARCLIDRDVYEGTREIEVQRGRAIALWRSADDRLKAALEPFDRTRWEFAQLEENAARNAMLRTLRIY